MKGKKKKTKEEIHTQEEGKVGQNRQKKKKIKNTVKHSREIWIVAPRLRGPIRSNGKENVI